jgi:asparagine synthase (glutamine-hydrolysing)
MLDGQGGDELLLGYERYYAQAILQYLFSKGPIRAYKEASLILENDQTMSWIKLVRMILRGWLGIFDIWIIPYRNGYLPRKIFDLCSLSVRTRKRNFFDLQGLQRQEIFSTNLPALLRYEDKNSMAHAVEARLPYLDYRFVSAAVHAPLTSKISQGWSKLILRKIGSKLVPDQVIWRRFKLGFNSPTKTWLGENSDLLIEYVEKSKLLERFAKKEEILKDIKSVRLTKTWRYINLAIWEDVFKVYLKGV